MVLRFKRVSGFTTTIALNDGRLRRVNISLEEVDLF
jgi:hypothetical protein